MRAIAGGAAMSEHYETCRACLGDGSINTSRDPRHVHGTTCRACSGFGTVEVKCDCCLVELGEIETDWPDIRKLCRQCAAGIVRDLDDQPDEARLLAAKLEEIEKQN